MHLKCMDEWMASWERESGIVEKVSYKEVISSFSGLRLHCQRRPDYRVDSYNN